MKRTCELCDSVLSVNRDRMPGACSNKSTIVHNDELCWLNSSDSLKKQCALSVGHLRLQKQKRTRIIMIYRELGKHGATNDSEFDSVLKNISPGDRQDLLDLSTNDLSRKIAFHLEKLKLPAHHSLKSISIPDDLPEEFQELLVSYRDLLVRRYAVLVEKNHKRSPKYVVRSMYKPIKFCKYLSEQGVVQWGQVRNSHLAAFLDEAETNLSMCLKRFIKYSDSRKNPFKKAGYRKPRRGGSAIIETPRPKIIPPQELSNFLSFLKSELDDARYLWAWLVCKMGLTAKRAYDLKLSDISLNEFGRCVIRPYEAWVSLPKNIEKIVIEQANAIYPVWRSADKNKCEKFRLLSQVNSTPTHFASRELQGKAKILRSSAIYAMMEKGHLDRTTLKTTIGVSMPTLAKIERLFSVDVHRRLDPEFIKLRNKHINGEQTND